MQLLSMRPNPENAIIKSLPLTTQCRTPHYKEVSLAKMSLLARELSSAMMVSNRPTIGVTHSTWSMAANRLLLRLL
jgi:hypothetical protein